MFLTIVGLLFVVNESVTCNSSNALAGGRTEPEIVDRRSKLVSKLVERELVFVVAPIFGSKFYFNPSF